MPRFYISDSAVPGVRCPAGEYATKSGRQSDVLNEAQAIARGRKLTITDGPVIFINGPDFVAPPIETSLVSTDVVSPHSVAQPTLLVEVY
jgi:hypothetical protein